MRLFHLPYTQIINPTLKIPQVSPYDQSVFKSGVLLDDTFKAYVLSSFLDQNVLDVFQTPSFEKKCLKLAWYIHNNNWAWAGPPFTSYDASLLNAIL